MHTRDNVLLDYSTFYVLLNEFRGIIFLVSIEPLAVRGALARIAREVDRNN